MKLHNLWERLIEISPLSAFLLFIKLAPPQTMTAWRYPYLIASVFAVVAIGWMHQRKQPLNRILLGVDVYLFSGLVAGIFQWEALNQLYGYLQAAAMLVWVLLIAVLASRFAALGLFGVRLVGRNGHYYDYLFIAVNLAAVVASWWFRGNTWVAEIIPFTCLFGVYGFCRSRLVNLTVQQSME